MKSIDYLQCSDCIKTLNEFFEKSGIDSDSEVGNSIAEFALFAEMKRLKSANLKGATLQMPRELKSPLNTKIDDGSILNRMEVTC